MRIALIHPNYRSGGAEIAVSWPPPWVSYSGTLKKAGHTDMRFFDTMTDNMSESELRARLAELQPDVIGCNAITPSIYVAEPVQQIAKEVVPRAFGILGGVLATFMYKQSLSEAR